VNAAARPLRILLISTADTGGGAELSAWNLYKTYQKRGHEVRLLVGSKRTADRCVVLLDNDASRSQWAEFWMRSSGWLERFSDDLPGAAATAGLARWIAEPIRQFGIARGKEDFHYPATWGLLQSAPVDVVHCFNLHGEYFDLRVLPFLSRRQPVVLDLRDAWLLSGHCAHSLDCDRWKAGCGQCPSLSTPPSIRRDATAFNWRRKRQIFAQTRVSVATPSRWMMNKIGESILGHSVMQSRVIPTGVDLTVFRPAERRVVRARLGISQDAKVLLFVANGGRQNVYKDYGMLSATVARLARECADQKVLFIALGGSASSADTGIRFVPHLQRSDEVAAYYQAADVYVHAAAADTFPRAVLEALACGVPVVATGVGGIPEQIRNLNAADRSASGATGAVVPAGDVESMTQAISRLLVDDGLRRTLGANAAADAQERFDLEKQADAYLSWYPTLTHAQQSSDHAMTWSTRRTVAAR
jgi:glycosyltransferase involved in cell wall biosynthesis